MKQKYQIYYGENMVDAVSTLEEARGIAQALDEDYDVRIYEDDLCICARRGTKYSEDLGRWLSPAESEAVRHENQKNQKQPTTPNRAGMANYT